jgi:hypothetical protein
MWEGWLILEFYFSPRLSYKWDGFREMGVVKWNAYTMFGSYMTGYGLKFLRIGLWSVALAGHLTSKQEAPSSNLNTIPYLQKITWNLFLTRKCKCAW